jgi:excisionase family DNA binding protein
MTDPLVAALLELLQPELRRLMREEIRNINIDDLAPRWLTVRQAAERIGIGPSAVRERIRQGSIPARKWEGRLYIEASAIDEAVATSEPAATVRLL